MGWVGVSSVWATSVAFCVEISFEHRSFLSQKYLVSLVGSSGSNFTLLAGSKLSQITVVITLPVFETLVSKGAL